MGFTRTVEDFSCRHCSAEVAGNGYTDHCPKCLWSRHVDIVPGDRASACGGMMEPVGLEGSSPDYDITYRCVVCGYRRRNRVSSHDDSTAILALARLAGQ